MFKKFYLLVLMGLFLMVGCQKEVIMPVDNTAPTFRGGGALDGDITDPNNEDEDEDDSITDPNNEDEEEDNDGKIDADLDVDVITDPNNEDEDEDGDK